LFVEFQDAFAQRHRDGFHPHILPSSPSFVKLYYLCKCSSNSPVTFTATATAKLAITSINGGINPTAGIGFSVVVQAQTAAGTPVTVLTDTTVTLSRTTGTGTLGGTLTGIILAGNSSVTISNVTYTKAESGVVLTVTAPAAILWLPAPARRSR
jgi:hypothetical protein